MKKNIFIILTIFFVVLLVGILYFQKRNTQINTISTTPIESTVPSSESTGSGSVYTLAEVATHNNENDCWLVIENKVYDVTSFIPDHPGGQEIIRGCGKDATSLFQGEREHQEGNAAAYLPSYEIGKLQ